VLDDRQNTTALVEHDAIERSLDDNAAAQPGIEPGPTSSHLDVGTERTCGDGPSRQLAARICCIQVWPPRQVRYDNVRRYKFATAVRFRRWNAELHRRAGISSWATAGLSTHTVVRLPTHSSRVKSFHLRFSCAVATRGAPQRAPRCPTASRTPSARGGRHESSSSRRLRRGRRCDSLRRRDPCTRVPDLGGHSDSHLGDDIRAAGHHHRRCERGCVGVRSQLRQE
jgi:hypothetical protein